MFLKPKHRHLDTLYMPRPTDAYIHDDMTNQAIDLVVKSKYVTSLVPLICLALSVTALNALAINCGDPRQV